jgi:hypothetical protein
MHQKVPLNYVRSAGEARRLGVGRIRLPREPG